jgi:hypothetical protein
VEERTIDGSAATRAHETADLSRTGWEDFPA